MAKLDYQVHQGIVGDSPFHPSFEDENKLDNLQASPSPQVHVFVHNCKPAPKRLRAHLVQFLLQLRPPFWGEWTQPSSWGRPAHPREKEAVEINACMTQTTRAVMLMEGFTANQLPSASEPIRNNLLCPRRVLGCRAN